MLLACQVTHLKSIILKESVPLKTQRWSVLFRKKTKPTEFHLGETFGFQSKLTLYYLCC